MFGYDVEQGVLDTLSRCARGQGHALRALPFDSVVHAQSRESDDRKVECVQLRRFWVFPRRTDLWNYFKARVTQRRGGEVQLLTTQNGISPKEAGFDPALRLNIPGRNAAVIKPSLMHDGKVINHGRMTTDRRSSPIT